jgi:hypothetical protein
MASELPDIPHDMQRLYRRFERWRSAHTGRLPIPERLWTAAAFADLTGCGKSWETVIPRSLPFLVADHEGSP